VTTPGLAAAEQPTTARNRVLLLVLLGTGITYLDRVCIAAAAPSITRDLGLSTVQMGFVFSVFALSYGLFEIPMGWLSDLWGQRNTMTRIVASWSAFTALTGLAFSYSALVTVRFCFGAAEAGAFPTLAQTLARWFPVQERGRVNGLMWMGARIGGAVAPSLAVFLISVAGWRATFFLFGLIGVVWCLVFWNWFRDDPATHTAVNAAELAYIRGGPAAAPVRRRNRTPWRSIFSSGSLWALFWMYFATSYGFYFLVTWLPSYLIREHGLTQQRAGFYAGFPLAAGALACLTGGLLSDWLVKRTGSLKWGRRLVGLGGYTFAALGYALAAFSHGPLASVACLSLASAAMDMAVPVAWAACAEVGGRFGGTATGFMNSSSSLSAMISPLAAAWFFDRYGSFDAMLASASAVYFLAGLLWFWIDPTRAVADLNSP
jgi:ACS family glucarate transporter-like MFS transporter